MEYPERTLQDLQNISNNMIGKIFYHRCEDNPKYYRTIRLHFNPFSNSIQKQVSNAVYGEPPEGLSPLPPTLFGRLSALRMSDGMFR
jgi:hypothetical protein